MRKIAFFAFIAVMASFLPTTSFGATFGLAQDYALRQGEEVSGDFYGAGGTVTLVGRILGDAVAAGGNLFLGDFVGEDALFVGGDVDVIGNIGEDLRVVAGRVLFRGEVGKDAVFVTGDLQILNGSKVSEDLILAVGKARIDGEVAGDIHGVAGEIIINGKVSGDVSITADSVILEPGALIEGNLSYASSREAVIQEGAIISGEKTFHQVDTRSRAEKLIPTIWGTWVIIKFIIILVSALLVQAIFRNIALMFVRTSVEDPAWSLVRGFAFLVAVPLALIVILLTFVGLPFVVLGGAAYTLLVILAYFMSPIILGTVLFKFIFKTPTWVVNWKSIVLGILALLALTPLGYVGTILQTLLFLLALGAIYRVLFDQFSKARNS